MTLTWLVILALIAINALYVAAEFGAVNVRRIRIRQKAEEGNGLAIQLLPKLEDPRSLDQYIAACQVGITISSLILGAYGQATLAVELTPLFERLGNMQQVAAQSASAIVVLLALTVLQMVLGELVPKSLALQFPTPVALYTVLPMQWSLRLLSWFIAVLNGSGWAILKLLRIPPVAHRHIHSPEEIRLLITESREGGALDADEQRRLTRALSLGTRPARQLMVPRVQIVGMDACLPIERTARQASLSPFTRFPVYRDSMDNVIGMVHAKDLAVAMLEEEPPESVEAIMRPILAVHETVTVDRVLGLLRERRHTQALVVDDFGGVAGLITVEDILKELLGPVADEFAHEAWLPERLPDGRVRLPGALRLYDTSGWVGVRWEGNSDTVGGLITELLGRFPEPGERLTIDGVPVQVEEIEGFVVRTVLATPADHVRREGHDG